MEANAIQKYVTIYVFRLKQNLICAYLSQLSGNRFWPAKHGGVMILSHVALDIASCDWNSINFNVQFVIFFICGKCLKTVKLTSEPEGDL